MKKCLRTSVLSVLFLSLFIFSCSENNPEEIINETVNVSVEKPDFRAILFGGNGSNTTKRSSSDPIIITTESDLIEADAGCYTVNVRVYISSDGGATRYLVANDNVKVGDCSNEENRSNKSVSECNGYLPDGNFVFENNTDDEICLYEVLTRNQEVYDQYTSSVTKLISKD